MGLDLTTNKSDYGDFNYDGMKGYFRADNNGEYTEEKIKEICGRKESMFKYWSNWGKSPAPKTKLKMIDNLNKIIRKLQLNKEKLDGDLMIINHVMNFRNFIEYSYNNKAKFEAWY